MLAAEVVDLILGKHLVTDWQLAAANAPTGPVLEVPALWTLEA